MKVLLARQVRRVLPALRALSAPPVPRGRLDPAEPTGATDLKDPQDRWAQQVHLARLAHKDPQD